MVKNLIFKLNQQLPVEERFDNDLNAAIICSIKDYVEGVTTSGSKSVFDQRFVDTLAVAAYPQNGAYSMRIIARALGGNRNTMNPYFNMKVMKQFTRAEEDDQHDEEIEETIEKLNEDQFLQGEKQFQLYL
jgi:hypothetical protein